MAVMPNSSVAKPSDHAGVYFPPPLFYLAALALGLVVQHLYPVSFLPRAVNLVLAMVCIIGSVALIFWSVITFRLAKTSLITVKPTTALVTDGPFRFTRNPMYLGSALLYLGVGLWLNALWVVVMLVPLLLVIQSYVIVREERYMERKFGQEYLQYKARVRRWL
jgi:protein-S-isoprenylcysteine O-methyltransferase Ste14